MMKCCYAYPAFWFGGVRKHPVHDGQLRLHGNLVAAILKDDAVKVLHSICQQIWKTQQWPQDWKRSVLFHSQRKAMPKNAQTTAQFHSSHMLVK